MSLKKILDENTLWPHLRLCQKNSIDKASDYLNSPVSKKSCLISLPTGAGKSGVICTLAHFSKQRRILGGVSKSMLTLNEAIIDVKEG